MDEFKYFILKKIDPPESVKRICTWQYAIVKVQTDKENKITDYQVLNQVHKDLPESFAFLKGYEFKKEIRINQRPIIFCLSIENMRLSYCDVIRPNGYTHARPSSVLKKFITDQHISTKDNIIIYDDKLIAVVDDPIR